MQQQKKGYQFSKGLIAGVSSVVIITGGFATWWAWTAIKGEQAPPWVPEQLKSNQQQSDSQDSSKNQPNSSKNQSNSSQTNSQQIQVKVYWLNDKLELASTSIGIEQSQNRSVVVEKALKHLLEEGVTQGNYSSTIPEGTQLRSVTFQEDGIHIDLSQEFTLGGGSTSMMGRLGQVLYTATSLDPEAKVWLEIQGEPLEYLGGEGVYIPQPLTRKKFKANYQL